MPNIVCPHCSGEYSVQLVVGDAQHSISEAPTADGYAWYRRGDVVNSEAVEKVRAFARSRPVARRFTTSRLYYDYLQQFEAGKGSVLSLKSFSQALRDLDVTPYRTGDARGFIFGTAEEIAAAPSGASWRANAERAVQSANEALRATIENAGQASASTEEWWNDGEAGTEPEAP